MSYDILVSQYLLLMIETQDSPVTFWQSLWKLLGSRAMAMSAHYPQANG